MINQDRLSEICRNLDAEALENPIDFWPRRDIDPEAVRYVAMQRTLRAIMLMRGMDLSRRVRRSEIGNLEIIDLTHEEKNLQMHMATLFMNGLAVGLDLD